MARHWSEVANAPLKRQGHYDAATEREARLIAAREAAQMHLQGAMTPDINETLPEDLADAMSAPRGLFMQRSSKSPNYPGYEGLAGFMAKDPLNAAKGYATGSVTGIGDLLSAAINMQAKAYGAPGRASLGDNLRRMLGQDPESPQGQVAEMVSPGGWMKGIAMLPVIIRGQRMLRVGSHASNSPVPRLTDDRPLYVAQEADSDYKRAHNYDVFVSEDAVVKDMIDEDIRMLYYDEVPIDDIRRRHPGVDVLRGDNNTSLVLNPSKATLVPVDPQAMGMKAANAGFRRVGKAFDMMNPTADEKLFMDLADAQRGAPEMAMLRAQGSAGGGLLGVALEHTGDLTHRMAEPYAIGASMGYEYVQPKVKRVLGLLRSGYGFEREVMENAASNSKFWGLSQDEYWDRLKPLLKEYADAHRSLPVYNPMQRAARDAAVAIGEGDYATARRRLERLEKVLDEGPEAWEKAASQISVVATKAHNAGPVPEGYLRFRHFGKYDVDTLKVEKFGTGIKGAERARGSKPVISLYPDKGFIKERDLGNHEYVIDIPMDQMYNANADPLGLKALAQEPSGSFRVIDGKMVPTGTRLDMNKYEDLIKEKGFLGYYTPDADGNLKGQARVFHDIEIR